MPKFNHYDIVVVGGGTAGCAAAYTAGKLGLKTLLIEKNIHLGGSITSGLVTPAMKTSEKQLNSEFYKALIQEAKALGGQVTYQENPGWFNPELLKIALDRLMAAANVEVIFDARVISLNTLSAKLDSGYKDNISTNNDTFKPENSINGLVISSNLLSVCIGANYIVDATGNSEIFVLGNCKFLENENKFQPVSLRFEMAGINLNKFANWLLDFDKDRDVTSVEEIDGQIHLSTAYTWDKDKNWALKPIFEDAVSSDVLKDEDRSYFQLFTIPGKPDSIAFNCPRIYFKEEIDPLSEVASLALIKGREAISRLAIFCKNYLPGFEQSYISNIADALGVRASRRIKGRYVYTVEDLRSGKRFENPILVSNYPIDVHSNKNGKSVLEKINQDYEVPVEALMSEQYDNLFVAGRGISADFLAQAALRIQPSCFSMGEGLVKHINLKMKGL